MKKIILVLMTFFSISIINFSNSLNSLTYRNGTVTLEFTEKIPKYIEEFDHNLPSLRLQFNETNLNQKNVASPITISDKYLSDILTEEFEGATNLVLYMQTGTTYSISKNKKTLSIKFSDAKVLPKRNYTIVLDAGHGGKDSGAVGNGYKEKDLALAVVLKLYENLKRDYNVVLTRSTDVFVALNERAEIGNRAKADLFVSVHLNSATSSSANGSEVFYFSKNPSTYAKEIASYENSFDIEGTRAIEASKFVIEDILYNLNQQQSANLANSVLDNIVNTIPISKRKVAGANFAVLRGSMSPSILIELGFISNYNDIMNFTSDYGQTNVANAIANAIRKHY